MDDNGKNIKIALVRRQHIIFVSMIIVGTSLIIMSQLVDSRLLSEGIAFIIVGFVGILMSWTTFDIGRSIKEAIREGDAENQQMLVKIYEANYKMIKLMDRITQSNDNIAKSQDNIAKSQDTTAKSQDTTARLLERILGEQKEIKGMLEDRKD